MDEITRARYTRFMASSVVQQHKQIGEEVLSELHLDFETRENGVHAVCMMCRGTVAQLTKRTADMEAGFVYTLEGLASAFMTHFMQRHYEQEGRTV